MGINGDLKRKECVVTLVFFILIYVIIAFFIPSAMGSALYVNEGGRGDFYSSFSDGHLHTDNKLQIPQVFKLEGANVGFRDMHFRSFSRCLIGYNLLSGDNGNISEENSDTENLEVEYSGPDDLEVEISDSENSNIESSDTENSNIESSDVEGSDLEYSDTKNSDTDGILSNETGFSLLIPFIATGFYNVLFFDGSAGILSFIAVHCLFFMFFIGVVVAYANAGPNILRDPSFREAMKLLLPLLFVGLFCVLFPYLTSMHDIRDDSVYIEVSKDNGIVTVKNEKGKIIHKGVNDAEAIEAALDEIDGGTIVFEKGHYDLDHTVRLKSDVSFVGNNEVVFDCISSPAFNTGTRGYSSSTTELVSDAHAGDTRIRLSSASGLRVGDYVKISDDFSVPYQRKDYKNGELVKIAAISGSTITIDRPLYDDYTVTRNAQVRKISMFKNIKFENIDFVGYGMDTSSTAIYFYGATNITISNCEFSDFGNRAISFWDCLDCVIEGSTFKRIFKDGTGYGIAITNACDNIIIRDNSFLEKGRHYIAVVAGRGGVTTDGFTRHVDVLNNIFRDCADEALNSHPTSAAIFIVDSNEFYDCRKGVEFSNSKSVITNNVFVRCANGVVLFDPGEHVIEKNSFRGNKISIIPHNTNSVTRDNFFEDNG